MDKRIVFIGQAPARPDSKHGVAGTYVRPWLYGLELDDQTITRQCRFYALIGSFPGSNKQGHLRPTPEQISEHRPVLIDLLKNFEPDILVPVGAMAIAEVLPEAIGGLGNIIGNVYKTDPFGSLGHEVTIIPWPHPSGRSTWLSTHPDEVAKAQALLKTNLT